jgi:hypothetical protein
MGHVERTRSTRCGCSDASAPASGCELYALSAMLDLPADATRAQLLDAMKDIIVGKAAYVGRFRQ